MMSDRANPAASRPTPWLAALLLTGLLAPQPTLAATRADFPLGTNSEQQACRAQWRFSGPGDPRDIDVYCAAWERPSGSLHVTTGSDTAALRAFSTECPGEPRAIGGASAASLQQVACKSERTDVIARYGLILSSGGKTVYGAMFPADWGPSLAAARVLIGLDKAAQSSGNDAATAGLSEIRAAFPAGAPGASAVTSYQLLRLRAYAENVVWNFDAAERDFSDLLIAHRKVLPDDLSGEGEILAEIAVNLSAAGRIQESRAALDQAEAAANGADDAFLKGKIANYRALSALGQHAWARALKLATDANAQRAAMTAGAGGKDSLSRISRADANRLEHQSPQSHPRVLVTQQGESSLEEKQQVLAAQADYIAAVALRALHRPGADAALVAAESHLGNVDNPPVWLTSSIYEERARAAIELKDAARAVNLTQSGLSLLRTMAPKTRNEGHMLFVLADAQAAAGHNDEALKAGRDAVAIYANQNEAPGFPANVAAPHLQRLLTTWNSTHDAALADEYFETLSLVWDGTAARAMAQLAARLGQNDGTGVVRAYQDTARKYRAAVARRERLTADPDPSPETLATVNRDVAQTLAELTRAEDAVRTRSPRYLELLNPKTSAKSLRQVLGPKEAYVRLILADNSGFGAFVRHDGIHPYAIGLRRIDTEKLVARVRDSVKPHGRRLPDYDLDAASRLYKLLFGQVSEEMNTVDTLHVDSGPGLSALPFGALVMAKPNAAAIQQFSATHDYRGVDWLARHQSIDVALGATAFLRIRTVARPAASIPVMAFGGFQPDPAGVAARLASLGKISETCRAPVTDSLLKLPALPETLTEVTTDAATLSARGRVVSGADFTDTAILTDKDVGNAEVLIIATHGVLGLTDCLDEPVLLTSLGPDGHGLLEASRMLDRALEARLVILSACDTAGGGKADTAVTGMIGGGEALSGLSRSFIYAGAANVLASQWPVGDKAARLETQQLITAARAGSPLVQGLSRAQAALFEHIETAHPFYWASFILLGDGMTRLEEKP